MDEQVVKQPPDYAPIWLTGLTLTALIATIFACQHAEPRVAARSKRPEPPVLLTNRPWPTALPTAVPATPTLPAVRVTGESIEAGLPPIAIAGEQEIVSDALKVLEATSEPTALASEAVRRRPVAPLAAQPVATIGVPRWGVAMEKNGGSAELLILVPGQPAWSAGAPNLAVAHGDLRFLRRDTARSGYLLGRWWAGARLVNTPLPEWVASLRRAFKPSPGRTAQAPPSRGPVLIGPGDRLAMIPRRPNIAQPKRHLARDENAAVQATEPTQLDATSPQILIRLLEELAKSPATAGWSERASAAIEQALAEPGGAMDLGPALGNLASEGLELANTLNDQHLAVTLRRACHAIDRRAASWRIVRELRAREQTVVLDAPRTADRLRDRLEAVLAATDEEAGPAADAWQRYLLADQLRGALQTELRLADRAALSASIIRRLSPGVLNADQRHYVNTGPIAVLGDELQLWGGPPTDATKLLGDLEHYESGRSPLLAQRIAADARRLQVSSTALHRQLAEQIEQKYRNANLRIAVSHAMVSRFLPSPGRQVDSVRDRIAGELVRGRSATETELSVRLLPDPFEWRLGLEAHGRTAASTFSNPGPVVLRNRSHASFVARKLITVGQDGLNAAPAVCSAANRTQLIGLSSYYDNVPLLGSVIRSQARDQYRQRRGVARRQSESRISQRVRQSLDRQTAPLLAALEQDFQAKVIDRTAALGMEVDPLEMRTTESRLIARLRVANDRQLAAHTPRNRAPHDSEASLQVHESLVNNALEGLGLSGRRWTPQELKAFVRDKLRVADPATGEAKAEGRAVLTFADEDPVQLLLEDGRAELILAIRELVFDKSRFRNFKVHAFYLPEVDGIEAHLVRQGGVQIEGRLRTGSRLKLHGVFTQVLDDKRPIPLLKLPPAGEPRLQGLMVTQLVIGDGWLGLAIGPEAGGQRVATVGRYVR